MRRFWKVIGLVSGYIGLLYLLALGSAIATTEARCLRQGMPGYRVTYTLEMYCVSGVRVYLLEALEVLREQKL